MHVINTQPSKCACKCRGMPAVTHSLWLSHRTSSSHLRTHPNCSIDGKDIKENMSNSVPANNSGASHLRIVITIIIIAQELQLMNILKMSTYSSIIARISARSSFLPEARRVDLNDECKERSRHGIHQRRTGVPSQSLMPSSSLMH